MDGCRGGGEGGSVGSPTEEEEGGKGGGSYFGDNDCDKNDVENNLHEDDYKIDLNINLVEQKSLFFVGSLLYQGGFPKMIFLQFLKTVNDKKTKFFCKNVGEIKVDKVFLRRTFLCNKNIQCCFTRLFIFLIRKS